MTYCRKCGAELRDGVSFCNSCGARVEAAAPSYGESRAPQNNYTFQPASAPAPAPAQPVYAPQVNVIQQPEPVTSAGAWFGWLMLLSVLPLIGTIIMFSSTKGSTKNFAKLQLIFQIIAIVIAVIVIIIIAAMGGSLMREIERAF